MATMSNKRETVVGVFLEEAHANRAMQALQSAGFNANVADESVLNNLPGVAGEEAELYMGRLREGNTVVVVNAGNRGEDALNMLLDYGAEYMNLHAGQGGRAQSSAQTGTQATVTTSTQTYGEGDEILYREYRDLPVNERQYGRYDANVDRARTAEELRLQLREEELVPVKQAVEAGEVEVRKVVHEE